MLSNSQYFPQGLFSQFPGLQAAGFPVSQFGPDSAQAGLGQQFPFGWGQQFPFGLSQQGGFGQHGLFGGPVPAHQIVPVLGQLAQQIAVQSAVAQQIGIAVHQLAHQLALQGLQGYPGSAFGAGQVLGGVGQPYIGGGAQPFGLGAQGAYGGFNPQAQAWGANRPQTIQ